jgi:voltage-gated potassium channel
MSMTPRDRVDRFINNTSTEYAVAFLILVSVCLILVEFALAGSASKARDIIIIVNDVITGVFVVELVLRFIAEPRKSRFLRRYWIDILAVLPLLRAFRILRLLRLFRVGIILSRQSRLFRNPLFKVEYVFISLAVFVTVVIGAISMRVAEGPQNPDFSTIEQAFWFSAMTLVSGEPIGAFPQTTVGRLVSLTLMMAGLTVFAILAGTVSAVMIDTLRKVKFRPMEIDEIKDHCVVCGWNRSAELILEELLHDDHYRNAVVITEREDLDSHPFFQHHAHRAFVLHGDFTRVDVLKEAGIERARAAILLADASKEARSSQDRDARTVLAAMLIEKMNDTIFTTVQLLNRDNETSLRRAGVEEIIVTDEYVGNIIGSVVRNRGMTTMLDELLTSRYGHQFFKERLPKDLVGKPVAEVMTTLKVRHNATLLAVSYDERGKGMVVNPAADLILGPEIWVIVAAASPMNS